MKDNYNIKTNPPELSSEQIQQHQDFDALFAQFQESNPAQDAVDSSYDAREAAVVQLRPNNRQWLRYGIGVLVTVAAAVIVVMMLRSTAGQTGLVPPEVQIAEAAAFELKAPLPQFEQPFETQVVAEASKGQVLEYQSGSKVVVPPAAFIDEKGAPVQGAVDIQYREFNDHVDMFLAGIPKKLGKHQDLQSVGMIEIKGFQDGKPVYLGQDKSLEIALQGSMASDMATADMKVYVYSQTTDNWQYMSPDSIVIQKANTNALPSLEPSEDYLAQAQQQLKQERPAKPIKPGVPDDMQIFEFDIDLNQFPELSQYHDKIDLMVAKDAIGNAFDTTWNDMKMTDLGNERYQLTLVLETEDGPFERKFEVFPAILATELAMQNYQQQLADFDNQQTAWEAKVADLAATLQQGATGDNPANEFLDIVNHFQVNRFGLWNCGRTLELSEEASIPVSLEDESGTSLEVAQLFVTNPQQQWYYSTEQAATTLVYESSAKHKVWALTEGQELLVASTDELPTPIDGQYHFQLKAVGTVDSEEALRALLTF